MAVQPKKVFNPPNPYLSEHRFLLGEPPAVQPEVFEDRARSILSRNDSPDLGFRWSVNPYRGCFHACAYCYARPSHEYLGLGAGTDFETKIFVKRGAADLLKKAFSKKSWKGELVVFSGITDCYQPLEAAWRLTRACLETCLAFRNPVSIITKSSLVRRDTDILKALARHQLASVAISIPFADEETARAIEPGTPTVRKRFETLAILAESGIPSGIAVAPIIPGLNDADIPALLKEAKKAGAEFAFHTLLRLPGNVREVFLRRLKEQFPLKADKVERRIRQVRGGPLSNSRFGERHAGTGQYWDTIDQMWQLWTRKLGFANRESVLDTSPRPRPLSPGPQREFQWKD